TWKDLDPPLRERWPGDVPSEPLQSLPIARTDDDARVQAVAVARRAQRRELELPATEPLDPSGLSLSDGRAPRHGRGLNQRQGVVGVVVALVRLGAKPLTREPRLAPRRDADDEPVHVGLTPSARASEPG